MVKLSFFKKKPKVTPEMLPERVRTLSTQGLVESEIIKTLKDEGFSPTDIDRSMKEALKVEAIGPAKPPALTPTPAAPEARPELPPVPKAPVELGFPEEAPAEARPREAAPAEWRPPEAPAPAMEEAPMPALEGPPGPSARRGEIEEIAESIIEEHFRALEDRFIDIDRKIDSLDSKIKTLETTGVAKGVKEPEAEDIKSSIESYKASIGDLSTRIEAMERAMKDSLTPMLQSMRSLTETVKALKKKEVK